MPFWRRLYYLTSHGTAQFYSVATFTGKNHFKLIHNGMKGVSARAYSTNYVQRLICNKLLLTDVNPGGGRGEVPYKTDGDACRLA